MKTILFLCNTHFQCIVATSLKYTLFKNDHVDIIITNQMVDSIELFKNIKEINIFNDVYHADIKDYLPKKRNFKHYFNRLKAELFPGQLAGSLNIKEKKYDYFFTYNLDLLAESLFYKLRHENKYINVCLYDEGVSTYTDIYRNTIYPTDRKKVIIKNIFKNILGRTYIADYTKDLYLLDPDLLCWQFPGEVHKISVPPLNDKVFFNILNKIYFYEEIKDKYRENIIFFEESYYWDNQPINDVELIENISQIVDRKNIMIKLHPRNRINRFETIGYKTNKQVGIPWEIIVMNMNEYSKKIFITVSSGSVLSYKLLFGKSYKTIMLYKCLEKEESNINEGYIKYFEKFKEKYSDNLYIPKSLTDLDELIKKLH